MKRKTKLQSLKFHVHTFLWPLKNIMNLSSRIALIRRMSLLKIFVTFFIAILCSIAETELFVSIAEQTTPYDPFPNTRTISYLESTKK